MQDGTARQDRRGSNSRETLSSLDASRRERAAALEPSPSTIPSLIPSPRPFAKRPTPPVAATLQPPSEPVAFAPLLLSGMGGFLVGVVVWHFVGFWGFVTHIVLKGPEPAPDRAAVAVIEKPVETPAAVPQQKWASRLSGEINPAPQPTAVATAAGACLAAVRGADGETVLHHCPEPYSTLTPAQTPGLAEGMGLTREDRAVVAPAVTEAAAVWSTAVELAPVPAKARPAQRQR